MATAAVTGSDAADARRNFLAERLRTTQKHIRELERRFGLPEGAVKLLPVTKFHPATDIAILRDLGVTAVGENREQEARQKADELSEMNFHMIGQIQTKKANAVARWAACVHSVDSERLAQGLDRGMKLAIERGERGDGVLDCFVQISLDADASRGGVPLADAHAVADSLMAGTYVRLAGVMCVPPLDMDPRAAFSAVNDLRLQWQERYARPLELSAGMSGDLEEAIASGSTIVRVGTAIMGPRPLP